MSSTETTVAWIWVDKWAVRSYTKDFHRVKFVLTRHRQSTHVHVKYNCECLLFGFNNSCYNSIILTIIHVGSNLGCCSFCNVFFSLWQIRICFNSTLLVQYHFHHRDACFILAIWKWPYGPVYQKCEVAYGCCLLLVWTRNA